MRGYNYPEVETAYERVRVLCEGLGDERSIGWACSGLSSFNLGGETGRAGHFAERVLTIAERTSDADLALRGHLDAAIVNLYSGRFAPSLAHLEQARARYDPERSYLRDSGFSINHPGVLVLYNLGWDLCFLGLPDQGARRASEAVALAHRIGHPYSIAAALVVETLVHCIRRDLSRQREGAAEAIAFSEANGFPFWQGIARALHAGARAVSGELDAVEELTQGLA